MEALPVASALYGLREDLRATEGSTCPMVTALVVQSLFGGRIFRYEKGLAGSDFVNEIRMGDGFYRIDLSQVSIGYDRAAFAAEECFPAVMLRNEDTYAEFHDLVEDLLVRWGDCA